MVNYWARREKEYAYNASLHLAEKELAQHYIRCFEKTKDQLISLYADIVAGMRNGREILPSDLYKYNKLYELLNDLNSNLANLGHKELKIGEERLKELYTINYELVGKEVMFNAPVNEQLLNNAIHGIWCKDGRNWSSRIWNNKALLEERVKNGVIDCFARGASKEELIKQLEKDFNTGFYCADRIARTELSYIQNQSTKDKYEEAGIEKYMVLPAHDERTCSSECEAIENKVFLLKDAEVGVNYPPIHPNCRCTTLAIIE